MIQAFSFTEQLVLNLVGPLVTIIVGTLVVGTFASWLARKAQERREDHALRERLITQALEGPIALYIASQRYSEAGDELSKELASFRAELDKAYVDARAKYELRWYVLKYHFPGGRPSALAHRINDLMMARYYQLREVHGSSDKLPTLAEHTGLGVDELLDPAKVLPAFHQATQDLTFAVTHDELAVSSRPLTPRDHDH